MTPGGRVLALDLGSARTGVAISDPSGTLATPRAPLDGGLGTQGLRAVVGLVRQVAPRAVVVGLPLTLRGTDSAQTVQARRFAARLAERVAVPVHLYDERFTTRLAGPGPGDDGRAAAVLLDGWLARERADADAAAGRGAVVA